MSRRTALPLVAALATLALPQTAGAADCDLPGDADPTFAPGAAVTGELSSELEGSYVYLPFQVPAGTTAVRVRYCHDQPEAALPSQLPNAPKHTLDLGLYEARDGNEIWGMDEFRGSGGSSVRDVTVAPNGFTSDDVYEQDEDAHVTGFTTRAFEPGPIPAGEWAVELGVAAVVSPSEGDASGAVQFRAQVELSSSEAWSNDPYSPAKYDTKPAKAEPGWYAGDFHVHGEHEPGNATMRRTLDYAFAPYGGEGAGLDFVTLVDHNNVVAYRRIGAFQDLHPGKLIARSTEVTTYRGHIQNHVSGDLVDYRTGPLYVSTLVDGATGERALAPIDPGEPARPARPASRIFADIRAGGGFTQINHPTIFPPAVPTFDDFCRGCAWSYSPTETDYSLVDAIEVSTGPAGLHTAPSAGPNPFTPLAIQFWEDAIDAGGRNSNHIAAVGSSDSHQAYRRSQINPVTNVTDAPIGMATTVVHAEELSEAGLLDAVRGAHTYVKLWGADGPDVRLEADAGGQRATIGDSLDVDAAEFTARVLGLDAARAARPGTYTLIVFRNGAPYRVAPIPASGDEFELRFPSDGRGRYRLQVQREGAIETISSPIWLGRFAEAEDDAGCRRGGDGPDELRGGEDADCLKGGRGRDELHGGAGDDHLIGGRGRDRVAAGPGDDRLRPGAGRDRVSCGGGLDLVRGLGLRDRAGRGCEKLRPTRERRP